MKYIDIKLSYLSKVKRYDIISYDYVKFEKGDVIEIRSRVGKKIGSGKQGDLYELILNNNNKKYIVKIFDIYDLDSPRYKALPTIVKNQLKKQKELL